ncbi:hypothetical protein Scep_027920 [Stephania cephalantha]|uniref:Uncharacterized protein n=1 Tax=Stephania cephalantha TaxID=152367 RepID=A0AAP0EGB3_9MAGN
MNQRTANPALERIWAEEVRYLHSLWHNNGLSPNPNPAIQPTNTTHHILRACNQISFKKPKNKKKIKKKIQDPQTSEIEWPCEPSPRKETEWPQIISQSATAAQTISAEEQSRREAMQLQQRSIKVTQDFFGRNQSSDCEDDSEEEGEGGGEDEFFRGVFEKDCDLRRYYEKKWESGEFWCLVCCGSGRKRWKKFKNCVALVQHSMGISRTDRKRAHRAFAVVVCRVLGWDIKRLPSIVLSVESLGKSLAQPEAQTQISLNALMANALIMEDLKGF